MKKTVNKHEDDVSLVGFLINLIILMCRPGSSNPSRGPHTHTRAHAKSHDRYTDEHLKQTNDTKQK